MATEQFRQFAKNIWAPALRSGDYAQGSHYLRVNNHYCCLGVLCALADATWDPDTQAYSYEDGEAYEKDLPYALAVEFGINTDPFIYALTDEGQDLIKWHDDFVRLSTLNDMGYDFNRIADIIDAAAEGVHVSFEHPQ